MTVEVGPIMTGAIRANSTAATPARPSCAGASQLSWRRADRRGMRPARISDRHSVLKTAVATMLRVLLPPVPQLFIQPVNRADRRSRRA